MDTCAVARQLGALPKLRAALLQGEVAWCMAAEVARHATPGNETFLVALAKRSSVRRMRALFRQGRARGVGDSAGDANNSDDADAGNDASPARRPARRPVRRRVDHEVAVLFEGMRELVEIHVGNRASSRMFVTRLYAAWIRRPCG